MKKYEKRKVRQYTQDGMLLGEYDSIFDASNKTLVWMQNIKLCCQYRLQTAGGYRWRYADEMEVNENER